MRVDSSVLSSEIKGTSGTLFGSGGACDGDMAPATSTANGSEATTGDRRVPLKTILQNFLNHVESLEARKREGDDGYEKEFQVSTRICSNLYRRSALAHGFKGRYPNFQFDVYAWIAFIPFTFPVLKVVQRSAQMPSRFFVLRR